MMIKKILYCLIITLILTLFSLDLGSITDSAYDFQRSAELVKSKPEPIDSLVTAFDHYLKNAVDSMISPGAAVTIVYKGEIILLRGYGLKKEGENDSVDIHTVFRLGSVSKGFASVLTGMMVNEGYLEWDDKVKQYLPDFKMKDTLSENILTVRQILSHATGFPEHTFTDLLDKGYTYKEIKRHLADVTLNAKPGQVYGYQNVVYSLIGDILQFTSGIDYNDLLKERIFLPLNMQDASTDFACFYTNPNAAYPHIRISSQWKAKPKNNRYYSVSPASGINASASDMAQWILALTGHHFEIINNAIIQAVSSHNIVTPRKTFYRKSWPSLENTYYGLGWRVFSLKEHDVLYHGGYVEGFRTEIAVDPKLEIGIAVMFNSNTSFASQCVPHFMNAFYKMNDQSVYSVWLVNK
jgi:beta-lactamase class C